MIRYKSKQEVLEDRATHLAQQMKKVQRQMEELRSVPQRYCLDCRIAPSIAASNVGHLFKRQEVLRSLVFRHNEYPLRSNARNIIQDVALGMGFTQEQVYQAGMSDR